MYLQFKVGEIWERYTYPLINRTIARALDRLRRKSVVIFPQTYYFSRNKKGMEIKKKLAVIYRRMHNLHIFTRDPQSFELVSKQLYEKTSLVPDMVLFLKPTIKNYSRKNALVLLRDDQEKTLTDREQQRIIESVERQHVGEIIYTDTHVHYDGLDCISAKNRIQELWDKYFQAKVVITDRLHGMIFAAITNTPCVVLLSESPKIKGVYSQWLKENEYITLVENLDDLPKAMHRVMNVKNPQLKRDKIDAAFNGMAQEIKEMIKEK